MPNLEFWVYCKTDCSSDWWQAIAGFANQQLAEEYLQLLPNKGLNYKVNQYCSDGKMRTVLVRGSRRAIRVVPRLLEGVGGGE